MGCCIPGLTFPMTVALVKHVSYTNIFWGILHHPKTYHPLVFIMAKALDIQFFRIPFVFNTINESRKAMIDHLDKIEKELSDGREWLLGNEYTTADAGMTALLYRLKVTGFAFLFVNLEYTSKYWNRLQERPSFKSAITD